MSRRYRLALAGGAVVFATVAGPACAPSQPPPQNVANGSTGVATGSVPGAPPAGNLRLVDPQTAPQGSAQRQGPCTALAPQGWTLNAGQYGDTADLVSGDGHAHASWGIRGVNTAMQQYYGAMFGPPDVATLATASMAVRSEAQYSSAPTELGGYFTAQHFDAGNVIGTVLYHAYSTPMPGQYVLSVFVAFVDRGAANLLPSAEAVMATISCQTQLRPPPPPGPSGAGSSGNSEDDRLKDYNMQLGTQWAHSSSGTNYLLDYASQWNDNGPDGPGYYIKNGYNYEKLTPGWGG